MAKLRPFKKNDKYGYKTDRGDIVVPLKYDFAEAFEEGTARVRVGYGSDRRYGLIEESGAEALPCKYEEMEELQDGMRQVQQTGKWGYADAAGRVVIPPQYDQSTEFVGGLANVKQGSRWGIIDKLGHLTLPLREMSDREASDLLWRRIRAQPLRLPANLKATFDKLAQTLSAEPWSPLKPMTTSDRSIFDLLSKSGTKEVIGWLKSGEPNHTLGEMGPEDSVRLAMRFYDKGAMRVFRTDSHSEGSHGPGTTTGCLVVVLSDDPADRKQLLDLGSRISLKLGFDRCTDSGQRYLFLMLD